MKGLDASNGFAAAAGAAAGAPAAAAVVGPPAPPATAAKEPGIHARPTDAPRTSIKSVCAPSSSP